MTEANTPVTTKPSVPSGTTVRLFVGKKDGNDVLTLVNEAGDNLNDGFSVKKNSVVLFSAAPDSTKFQLSDFTKAGEPVDAPWTRDTYGSITDPNGQMITGKDGRQAFKSGKSRHDVDDPVRDQIIRVKLTGEDQTAGSYSFQVTMNDYRHDPEFELEC